ncbi:uncharacterized protein BDR25DRAFT_103090 [Lindgomyces ingoldianus]|uniref:Uncharacterized protein n=1 Tax=Lindgomyces ingoldianus TaxID=673940 RepID=A0ACB6R8I6_9PLEO|nr:uncharacterized protein BDR25DRAFT_103090 [Lindgomyces ingoldianus]KAF2475486.1 hypothetical protein BDR25DRAFT_103090 [Lindgomyces ingoldianus]
MVYSQFKHCLDYFLTGKMSTLTPQIPLPRHRHPNTPPIPIANSPIGNLRPGRSPIFRNSAVSTRVGGL